MMPLLEYMANNVTEKFKKKCICVLNVNTLCISLNMQIILKSRCNLRQTHFLLLSFHHISIDVKNSVSFSWVKSIPIRFSIGILSKSTYWFQSFLFHQQFQKKQEKNAKIDVWRSEFSLWQSKTSSVHKTWNSYNICQFVRV